MKFKQLRKHLNEVNGQEGPVLRMSYRPQRQGRKLPSHSTITKSDLYDDVVYNSKNWEITANTNSLAIRIPSPKGHEKDRQTWMDLIDSAKGDTSNMIRGGGLTQSEVDELARDMEKAAKDFKATTMVAQEHEIYVSHKTPGKLKVVKGLMSMLKAVDEFGMRNHVSVASKDGVLTRIQDAGQYNYNESVNEETFKLVDMSKKTAAIADKLAKKIGLDTDFEGGVTGVELTVKGSKKKVEKWLQSLPTESVNEGMYTKDDGGAFDGLRIAKYLAHQDGKNWDRLPYGILQGYIDDGMEMLKRNKAKARDILSKPTPR